MAQNIYLDILQRELKSRQVAPAAVQQPGNNDPQIPETVQSQPETKELAPQTVSPEPRNRKRAAKAVSAPPKPEDLSSLPSEERHRRKCEVCRHPERELIEGDFLQWRTAWAITREFNISEPSLYRHAHAFGLLPLRRENLRLALDRIVERGVEGKPSGDTIIRAVRAQACLTDDNRWVEPTKHVVFSNASVAQITPSPAGNILNVGAPQLTAADLGATPAIEGGFHQSEISSRESQFLIESPTIRNEG